jgi:hypothetical protein
MSLKNYTLAYMGKTTIEAKKQAQKLKKSGFITKLKGKDVWRKFNKDGF